MPTCAQARLSIICLLARRARTCRGLYRSSSQPPWLCPDNVIPRGSSFNETLGAIHTPLQADRTGRGELTASLRIPKAVQPAFLAFKLYIADPQRPRFAKPLHGNSVVVPLGVGQGSPLRLGATVAMAAGTKWPAGPANVNFAVTSRHACATATPPTSARVASWGMRMRTVARRRWQGPTLACCCGSSMLRCR